MHILILCALLLGGCAAKMRVPLPDVQPVQAQFGLLFSRAGMSIPLQGAVQVTGNEGSLGIIFPHGRTLGVCRYRAEDMECTPAAGDTSKTRFILSQIGLAVSRILPALARESTQDVMEADWAVRWKETDAGRSAEYQDLTSQVTMNIHVTEISRP